MVANDYQINNIFLFPYQFALQHFQAVSQEAEWNGRVVVHLVLGIFEILPTGINYIIAIFDAVFYHNPPQVPVPFIPAGGPFGNLSPALFANPPPADPGWSLLPTDLLGKASTFLTPKELGRCMSVCKTWGGYINGNNQIWNWQAQKAGIIKPPTQIKNARQLFAKPDIAFGRGEWIRYLGDPGEVLPLPRNIYEILKSPCPFWPGKTVEETHILVFIPQAVTRSVDGHLVTVPLTLKTLDELLKSSNNGTGVGYRHIWGQVLQEHGDTPVGVSHWVLMTGDVVPESRNKPYPDQKSLVENHQGYEVPSLLDATASILLEYIRSGRRLFSNSPLTYTRCQETILGFPSAVGGFAPSGLRVSLSDYDCESDGVAGLRKFSGH
jgi:hypothetical protein